MLSLKTFVLNPFAENTYVVYDPSGECAIIDPGNYNLRETLELCSFINDNKLKIKYLLITHGHVDHIVGIQELKNRYGVKLSAHPDVKADLDRSVRQAQMFGFTSLETVPTIDVALMDDEILTLGESVLEVRCTPGHAEGSVSYYAPVEGWVFTGDALFCRSVGRTDFAGGDFVKLRNSIHSRLFTLPDDTAVLPGHGEKTSIGEEKDFNPFVAF